MRKSLVVVAVLAAGSASVIAVRHARHQRTEAPVSAHDPLEAEAPPPRVDIEGAPARAPSLWPVGAHHRYSVEAHLEFGRNPSNDGPAASANWNGTLDATVLGHQGDLVDVGYQIQTPHFTVIGGPGGARTLPEVERQLTQAFAASYDPRGRLREMRLPAEMAADAQPLVRGLVSSMQFTMPDGNAAQWSSEEIDAAGEYAAAYRRLPEDGRYRRVKERYLRVMGPSGLTRQGASAQAVGRSQSFFTMGTDGRLAALDLVENGGVDVAGKGPEFNTHIRLTVRLMAVDVVSPEGLATRLRRLPKVGVVAATSGPAGPSDQADRDLVQGATLAMMLSELGKLPKDALKDRALLQARLSALFRTDPRSVADAVARLKAHDPDSDMLAGALAAADTPATQKALVNLAVEPGLDRPVRDRALANLTMIDHPDPSVSATLRPLLHDPDPEVRSQAALAVGAAGNRTAEQDPAAARSANQDLLSHLAQAKTDEEKLWALRAIGNAAHPESLEVIKQMLASDNPEVREAAGQALRAIPGDEAEQMLIATMRFDSNPAVRRGAVFAARFREGDRLVEPLGAVCREDVDEGVREMAIETLGYIARSSDSALPKLQWSAENDPSDRNRRIAREIIEGAVMGQGG